MNSAPGLFHAFLNEHVETMLGHKASMYEHVETMLEHKSRMYEHAETTHSLALFIRNKRFIWVQS